VGQHLDKRLFVRPENRWGDNMNVLVGDVLQGWKLDRIRSWSSLVMGIHVNSDESSDFIARDKSA
jgi:hypothetical protein